MVQIIVNTCFDAVFQDLLLFISPVFFFLFIKHMNKILTFSQTLRHEAAED